MWRAFLLFFSSLPVKQDKTYKSSDQSIQLIKILNLYKIKSLILIYVQNKLLAYCPSGLFPFPFIIYNNELFAQKIEVAWKFKTTTKRYYELPTDNSWCKIIRRSE